MFKININVTGDFVYTSANKFNQTIHLTLINEHYDIVKGNLKSKNLLNNIPQREQKLVTVLLELERVKCYDGNNIFYVTYEEYDERKSKSFNGDYVYLKDLPIKKTDFVKDYHDFVEECEKLKELTNGRIDLAKSGYKVSNEALKSVHFSLLSFNEPEELSLLEQEWYYRCFKGGLIFCENNITLDYAYNYDKKSAYPSMLSNDHFSFPVKEGEFIKINELPDILKYGIYRCIIIPCGDENVDKLFRFNSMNYYTHYDIKLARNLKLPIYLIQNNEANALIYDKGRGNGANYFRQVVHSLYDLKTKSKLAKSILNAIWGALCQRNKITTTTKKKVDLNKSELVTTIEDIGNGLNKIQYLNKGKYFKHSYARIGCFLTSAVRKHMAEIIYPVREHVFKCHTDSILSDIQLDNVIIGSNIGDFALEHEGKCKIHHSSLKLEWL